VSPERIGRYEIIDTLGRGAMGVVYLARDPLIGREVALKTLRVDLDDEMAGEFRERFFREAQAAGRLNHPGIVTVHDVGEDTSSGLVYIAMEYVHGRDLKQLLAEGRRFRPAEAARIVADVAVALDYAHGMGVVHRDIKPANVLLSRDGTARITDFGVARLESSNLTVDGQFIGTPNFMSPEQIAGRTVDGRSDIFSLGVVLFTVLTGQRPFAGGSMHEVTMRIVQEPAPIPSTVAPGIPPAFNPIILKCLEKDPDKRFQTGAEVARVLGALARSLVARDSSDPERTGVVQPDLATRLDPPRPAADAEPSRQPAVGWRQRLPIPPILRREVDERWAAGLVAGCLAVLGLVSLGLASRIDDGPFHAPSGASSRALHAAAASLQASDHLLASGELLAAEAAALRTLDQAPGSPAARTRLVRVRRLLEEARDSAEVRMRADALVAEGREAYRAGRWDDAAARFSEAIELDADNELAASFLELAEERRQTAGRSTPRTRSATASRPTTPDTRTARDAPTVRPTPGTARVTVFFNSPLNAGALRVTIDDVSIADVPFDFTERGFLGIRRKGTGAVKRVVLIPSGTRRVGIELLDADGRSLGVKHFDERLAAGSDWTLRVDMPDDDAAPGFFLVRARP